LSWLTPRLAGVRIRVPRATRTPRGSLRRASNYCARSDRLYLIFVMSRIAISCTNPGKPDGDGPPDPRFLSGRHQGQDGPDFPDRDHPHFWMRGRAGWSGHPMAAGEGGVEHVCSDPPV
jgi:hypothetical protein